MTASRVDAAAVRRAFDCTEPFTIGLEEEVLLVDPQTAMPVPVADAVVAVAGNGRIKLELPACQVEIMTAAHACVADALAELQSGRKVLLDACGPDVRPAAIAVHPLVVGSVPVASSDRGRALFDAYGEAASRQLVGALQVHVALGDSDRALAVYNTLRGHLPELAALAAAAPFHEGRDTGFASIRPLIAGLLPRQGVPPAIASWEAYAEDLQWGAASGRVPEPRQWWWELRPHVLHGTLEVRVPDVQPTMTAATAVAEVVHALVRHLAERHDDGAPLPVPLTWRIAENRWAAFRGGVHGELADLESGQVESTAARLHGLLDTVEPHAPGGLDGARRLVERNSSDELRDVGIDGAVAWTIERFCG